MNITKKKLIGLFAALGIACVCVLGLSACGGSDADQATNDSTVATYADIDNMDLEYTDRDKRDTYDEATATKIVLTGQSAEVEGEGVSVDGSQVTIEAEGTYLVSGTLDNGQLAVNTDENTKVQVVLTGATVHNDSSAALYVQQADKCFITLAPGTENVLSDSANHTFAEGEDEPNATLFSKDDLTINGTGTLSVTGEYQHGIYSKDDLVITGGTYEVSAVGDGLRGKDALKILDGTFTVEAGEDCLKASRDDDPARGYATIDGGTFTLNAGDDAIHSETYLRVSAGTIDVATCTEGLEAMVVQVDDGEVHVVSTDDAINASAPSESSDTTTQAGEGFPGKQDEATNGQSAGEFDGDRASGGPDEERSMRSGEERTFHGEGAQPPASKGARDSASEDRALGGEPPADLPANDGGMKGGPEGSLGQEQGGSPDGDLGKGMNGGMDEGDENCKLIINGGKIVLEAGGDGLDSNGMLEINGGTVYVTGPTSNGDGALDYAISAACNGGTILIVGPSGMAEDFTTSSQPSAFVRANGSTDQEVSVLDQAGKELFSYTPTASFQTAIVSSPDFVDGQTYQLKIGSTTTEFTAVVKQVGQNA